MPEANRNSIAVVAIGMLDRVIDRNQLRVEAGGDVTVYHMRAYDSGTTGWVTWTSSTTPPDVNPSSGETTPNYTGTLSAKHVQFTRVTT